MKKKENALGRMFYLFIYLFFPLTNVENRLLMSYLKKKRKKQAHEIEKKEH